MQVLTVCRRLAPCLVAGVVWLANPAESSAIFHWFSNCCSTAQPYTYGYAGPFCNSGVQVNYLPTTAYRTTYVNVPVTTMRTCAMVDPCTGCQTTAMRPVTTIVAQPRLVPYNTYRLVTSAPIRTYYAGSVGCCAPAASYYTPSYSSEYPPSYSSSYSSSVPVERSDVDPARPVLDSRAYEPDERVYDDRGATQGASRSRQTYSDEEPAPAAEIETRKKPIHIGPEDDARGETGKRSRSRPRDEQADELRLVNPNNKTARRFAADRVKTPVRPASSARPPRRAPLEDDGWRPSNR